MNLLLVHQNFPGQFKHLAPALAARGHAVHALTARAEGPDPGPGVTLHRYAPPTSGPAQAHPWVRNLEDNVRRGEQVWQAATRLRQAGWHPDAILAHPGWGEALFLDQVWPGVPIGLYAEYWYRHPPPPPDFDPDFAGAAAIDPLRFPLLNAPTRMSMSSAVAGWSPTRWQADTYPTPWRERIRVIHDGIDTRVLKPDPAVSVRLGGADGLRLTRADEVVTFVNRNLEPARGYHVLMRALPRLLRERPAAQVLLVGGDGASYGPPPARGSWKQRFIDEVRPLLAPSEWKRVHFLGRLPYAQYVAVLQLSRAHVYLTYPFVLSWSLLEAMSIGCPVVASDVDPVREVVSDGQTGLLVPFADADALAGRLARLLAAPALGSQLGAQARARVLERYDLASVCLPAQIDWMREWAGPV